MHDSPFCGKVKDRWALQSIRYLRVVKRWRRVHMTPEQIERKLDRILLSVAKPGRYVGGEYNSVVKDWINIPFRAALAFPDIYDLGMSNLGLMLLYGILNDQPDMLAE